MRECEDEAASESQHSFEELGGRIRGKVILVLLEQALEQRISWAFASWQGYPVNSCSFPAII